MIIFRVYTVILPVILAGASNMLVVRTAFLRKHVLPVDCRLILRDGKRLFGEHKTVLGMLSMTALCVVLQVVYGILLGIFGGYSDLYRLHRNTVGFNALVGFLFGGAYMVCELPNSFLKRRLDIAPGGTTEAEGLKRVFFFLLDQFDSVIGVMLVLKVLSELTWREWTGYVLVGGFTHLMVNVVLKALHIRRAL